MGYIKLIQNELSFAKRWFTQVKSKWNFAYYQIMKPFINVFHMYYVCLSYKCLSWSTMFCLSLYRFTYYLYFYPNIFIIKHLNKFLNVEQLQDSYFCLLKSIFQDIILVSFTR